MKKKRRVIPKVAQYFSTPSVLYKYVYYSTKINE